MEITSFKASVGLFPTLCSSQGEGSRGSFSLTCCRLFLFKSMNQKRKSHVGEGWLLDLGHGSNLWMYPRALMDFQEEKYCLFSNHFSATLLSIDCLFTLLFFIVICINHPCFGFCKIPRQLLSS